MTCASVDDSTIRKKIWEGSIPVVFTLAPHEVTSLHQPHPYYVILISQSLIIKGYGESNHLFDKLCSRSKKSF